ncbi:MAG: glycerol-3-phosphate 1-O-acyltransferase [Acidobacteria bacterium]|nr:glycerol-3-phosphate 1-O-acyltransferase [Acidobacteriota bacterium]
MTLSAVPPPGEEEWPQSGDRPVAFLVDASSSLERRLIGQWIERNRPGNAEYRVCAVPPSRRRRFRRSIGPALKELASGDTDVLLVPLRVVWLGPRRTGRRIPRLVDLLTYGDPRDPNRIVQELFVRFRPDRIRVVVGEAAPVSDLKTRWVEARTARPDDPYGFAEYIALQGKLTLEVAERRVRGNRYKVPRLLSEDLLGSAKFQLGLERLAAKTGERVDDLARKSARYLKEIAAQPSTFVIDLVASLIRLIYTQGYDRRIQYDPEALERIAELGQRHSLAFLPSHKSNMDHLALTYVLYENGLPPNHAAGGINMNFFPVGPFLRRHGLFFIRRSFRDNEVYKYTLKRYLDYLLEKRFPLEWYIEGGRSRSGKLNAPKYGLLSYVVDSWRRGSCEDVVLIPTSIAYDQIQDVGAYAAEQRGGAKEKESFRWLVRVLRTMRRRYGRIYLNFGEPISLADTLNRYDTGYEPDPEESNLEIQKLAFEVAVRINRVTPITPISLVTIALLGTDHAVTVDETIAVLRDFIANVERRRLPISEPVDLEDVTVVSGALDALVEHGVVSRFDGGRQTVYEIGSDQHLAAAYYRNTIVHFFTTGAIAELGLAAASGAGVDRLDVFWDTVRRTRDRLKFEYFFAERKVFRAEMTAEIEASVPGWEAVVASGDAASVLRALLPSASSWALRPVFEAYLVLADALVDVDFRRDADEAKLIEAALALGAQYRAQRAIRSPEAVSTVLFKNAVRLAANRDLLLGGDLSRLEEREAFASDLHRMVELVGDVERLRD